MLKVKKYSKKQIVDNFVKENNLENSNKYFLSIWFNIRSDNSHFRLTDDGFRLLSNSTIKFFQAPFNLKLTLATLTKISSVVNCPFYIDLGKNKFYFADQDLAIKIALLEDINSFLKFIESVDSNS